MPNLKLLTQIIIGSFCTVIPLQAASSFLIDSSTVQFTGGSVNLSSINSFKNFSSEHEIGTGNSSISFTSRATQGNLEPYAYPTFITSTVSAAPGGTFDLILRAGDNGELDPLAQKSATQLLTYNRHKIRSNGDSNSFTFTQTYSQAWMPSRRYLANPGLPGNLIWSLGQGVDFGTQNTSLVAIDVRYFDENLNLIDLTSVRFKPDANSSGHGNAASFSQAGTTATMIYGPGATSNSAGLTLLDLNTGDLNSEFIGKIEYTFRTTDGSDFSNNVAFQYTTNGAVYASSPVVIPEPTSCFLMFCSTLFALFYRRR